MASRTTNRVSQQLVFDGKEENYGLWETRFLGYLHTQKLKDTILREPQIHNAGERAVDDKKNADCYAELIQLIDDKSLSLIMHDASDKGREALGILREHYAGRGKPRIIGLYSSLTTHAK